MRFRVLAVVLIVMATVCVVAITGSYWLQENGHDSRGSSNISSKSQVHPNPRFETKSQPASRGSRNQGKSHQIVESAIHDPQALLDLIPSLIELGLIDDIETMNVYRQSFKSFSPTQLAELLQLWPGGGQGAWMAMNVTMFLERQQTPDTLRGLLEALPREHPQRGSIVQRMGRKSPLFAPERIEETAKFLDPQDLTELGIGLSNRLRNLDPDVEYELLIEYLEVLDRSELTGPLVSRVVELKARNAPLEMKEWLLSEEPTFVQQADTALMKELTSSHLDEAISFANTLLERGEVSRASIAVEAIGKQYRIKDPQGAYDWALSLPSDLDSRMQVLVSAYALLCRSDRNTEDEILSNTSNSALRADLEAVRDSIGVR